MRSKMLLIFFYFLMAHVIECVVSQSPVQAFVGTNVLLPCECPANKDLSWQVADSVIASFSEDVYSANHSQFINRTQLFKEKKNCSLLILGVKVADQAKYTCHSVDPGPLWSQTVELKVVAKYSASCIKKDDELVCEASNGYPKGKIYWRDEQHVFNSSEMNTKEDGSSRLFNLSSTLKGTMRDNVKCVVEMPVETITVNCSEDESITNPHKADNIGSSWAIGVAVISTLVVALCALVVYLSYRRKCARVRNDHVENENEYDETEDSPHQSSLLTHTTTES